MVSFSSTSRKNYAGRVNECNPKSDLKRVQQGFWLVTHGSKGTARGILKANPTMPQVKLGPRNPIKMG